MPTYRLDLAYDGGGFRGYARQPGVRTVQGELESALARLLGEDVETSVAGRTDAGVHAHDQVVSFRSDGGHDPERLHEALLGMLAPEMAVVSLAAVDDGFDARRSAVSRTYRYHVLNRQAPDPFRRHLLWHVQVPLDRAAMAEAAGHFPGERDFASFCRAAEGRSTVRRVLAATWSKSEEDLLCFEVTASSFCHQMVRSMVALSVEVGRGRVDPGAVPGIIEARDRSAGRGAAPPHGLTLWRVDYG